MFKIIGFALIASSLAQASTTKISNLEGNEIFVNDGRVYEIDVNNERLVSKIKTAVDLGATVKLKFEAGPIKSDLIEVVKDIKILDTKRPSEMISLASEVSDEELHPLTGYQPTILTSMEEVDKLFDHLIWKTRRFSECFNRAHIWSKQMHQDFGVKSQKILIYWTKRYRDEVDKKWWFHIAPSVYLGSELYVLDREFSRDPQTALEWEEFFIQKMRWKRVGPKDYRCKQILNIKEYYAQSNQVKEYCNVQHTSMYYWEPHDMERLDEKGTQKLDWVDWELKESARQGFVNSKKVYDQYKP